MFCCLTACTARALLRMANGEFRIQVITDAVVACPEPEQCHLFPSEENDMRVNFQRENSKHAQARM